MLYVKIGENKYPAEIQTFKTQHGHPAVRVKSEAPVCEGFLVVDEFDEIIVNYMMFDKLYREEGNCKEYVMEAEEIVPTQDFTLGTPDSAYDVLSKRISAVSNSVSDITPFVTSKLVGIQDKECVFTNLPVFGVVTASLLTEKGVYLPCEVEVREGNVRVIFDELNEVATVTVNIQ